MDMKNDETLSPFTSAAPEEERIIGVILGDEDYLCFAHGGTLAVVARSGAGYRMTWDCGSAQVWWLPRNLGSFADVEPVALNHLAEINKVLKIEGFDQKRIGAELVCAIHILKV